MLDCIYVSKILTKIIQRRMERMFFEENLGEEQFGFKRNRVTREAIPSLGLLKESAFIRDNSLYIGFIYLKRASIR